MAASRGTGEERLIRAIRVVYGRSYSLTRFGKELAKEVRARHGLPRPSCPFELAKKLGVPVTYVDLPHDGALVDWPGPAPRIELRDLSRRPCLYALRRQRFTAAHELGHLVLRRALSPGVPEDSYRPHDPPEERICDAFAAELLLPRGVLVDALRDNGVSPRALLDLSEDFGVSVTMLCSAITDVIPKRQLMVVIWRREDGTVLPHWTSDIRRLRRTVLVDTGRTTVERTFSSGLEEHGRDQILTQGERQSWRAASFRLRDPDKVLTVLVRPECEFEMKRHEADDPKQLSLFGGGRGTADLPRSPQRTPRDLAFLIRPMGIRSRAG